MNAHNATYRFAVGVAIVPALMLVWLSLGVGIIGRDGDPALFFLIAGVLLTLFANAASDGVG